MDDRNGACVIDAESLLLEAGPVLQRGIPTEIEGLVLQIECSQAAGEYTPLRMDAEAADIAETLRDALDGVPIGAAS